MMVVSDELLGLSRKAVEKLLESGESCIEIEGAPGVFLCLSEGDIPVSYVKLATISAPDGGPEKFDIYTV